MQEETGKEDLLDLNEVMRAFDISAWKNLGPDESAHGDALSLLVDVEGQRYTLRERPEGMLGEDLQHRYAFRSYLQQAGIPIPALQLTAQSEPAVAIGEDYFELQRYPVGEVFSSEGERRLDWIESAGFMLGRIHDAARAYRGPQHRWPAEANVGAMVQGWLNLARSRADESAISAIAAALEHCVDQWEAALPKAMVSIGAGGALPEWHIHGDYHALNLRFDPSGVTAVLGLEASHWEKRIFEVAFGLAYFSALAWRPGESLTRPLVMRGLEPESARRFLRGYAELCPPVKGEAELLTDALTIIAPVISINGPLEDLFYAQEEPDEGLIDDVMERLNWAASLPGWLARVRGSLAEMWI